MKKQRYPFEAAVDRRIRVFGEDAKTAMEHMQVYYSNFKIRNQALIERQNDAGNNAQTSLISHTATLAILILTALGFLAPRIIENATPLQKRTFFFSLSCEVIVLAFGIYEYVLTVLFHKKWAMTYKSIDDEGERRFDESTLYYLTDLGKIEAKHTKQTKAETNQFVYWLLIIFTMLGLASILAMYYGYLFDVPYIS